MQTTRRRALAVLLLAIALGAVGIRALVTATQDHSVHRRPASAAVTAPPPSPEASSRPGSATARVVVLVEENHEYSAIIGSRSAPFINSLAAAGTLLTSYFGIRHPSLPNYLALIGGDTFGVRSDCTRCRVDATNLVDQLEAAHISWRGYFQGLPGPCSAAAFHGAYAKKHNPFMYFDDIALDPTRCRNVVPFGQFDADLAAGRLPRFAFVVPDQDHDMHSASIAAGDQWAKALYDRLSASSAWQPGTRLVLTFDEGSSDAGCCDRLAAGGRVATIIAGPGADEPLAVPPDNELPAGEERGRGVVEENGRFGPQFWPVSSTKWPVGAPAGPGVRRGITDPAPYNHYSLLASSSRCSGSSGWAPPPRPVQHSFPPFDRCGRGRPDLPNAAAGVAVEDSFVGAAGRPLRSRLV